MAISIAESPAKKSLLPLKRSSIEIVGVDKSEPLPQSIDMAIRGIKNTMTR